MSKKILVDYKINFLFRNIERILSYSNIYKKSKKPATQVLILGSGFAGIEVLKYLQRKFRNDSDNKIDITLVSKDNFFLFTPMLPEVTTGMIEIRHIVTPVRTFCKKAKFYEACVKSRFKK